MSAWRLFLIIITSLSLWACASGHQPPFPSNQPVVRNPEAIIDRLCAAVDGSAALNMKIIGQVRYDNFEFPVRLIQLTNHAADAPKILLTAGVHGNEPAGVESAVRLVERLASDPHHFKVCTLEIIPVVNPWGWSHDIRFNQQGIDVNRDFAAFVSQEARIMNNYLQNHQYHLIIDLHEDPDARGFYMYQYGRSDKTVVEPIVTAIAEMGHPIEQDIKMVTLKTQNGIIDAPMWGLWYMRLTRQLSITNYGRLYNSPNVFTIETPTILDWEDRLQMHQRAIEMLMDAMLETNHP